MSPGHREVKRQEEKKSLLVNSNAAARSGFKPGAGYLFFFDTPLNEPDTSLIDLFVVADTNMLPLDYTLLKDSTSNKKLILKHQFMEDSTYVLTYDKGAFVDIFGNPNDSTTLRFTVSNKESYGTLKMRLSGYSGNIILQLINSKDIIVKEDYVVMEEICRDLLPLA